MPERDGPRLKCLGASRTIARAERGERVRPEPFEAIELVVGTLFGDDPDE